MANVHTRARQSPYSGTDDVHRVSVSDEQVSWTTPCPNYEPTEYTAKSVLKNPAWADDPDVNKIKHFNQVDGKLNRQSFLGKYDIDKETNRPLNPRGRTGLAGRGLLGRWGPNHAADPLVTRWAQNSKQKVLEIVLINRKDTGDLAFPGGMVDPGEEASETAKREFIEEALNSNAEQAKKMEELFRKRTSIYKGYIDEPRNTDNAWIESEAVNVHDDSGDLTKDLKLESGDDAGNAQWIQLDRDHHLHGSHEQVVRTLIQKHGAYEYWGDNQ